MFIQEIKRGLKRKTFIIAFIILLLLGILHSVSLSRYESKQDILNVYSNASLFSAYDGFFLFAPSIYGKILFVILPLINSFGYADSYLEDKQSGILKYILLRKQKGKYLCSKYFANFVISGGAVAISLLVSQIIVFLKIPSIEPNPILGAQTICSTQMFSKVFYSHPSIYILIWIIIMFLYSGVFASISMSLSIFIKKRTVVIMSSFMLFSILSIILESLGKSGYNPLYFLYLYIDSNAYVIFGEVLVLFFISFSIFFIGGSRDEIL